MRKETSSVQQSTSSEANSRVASLDIGCCYYSVHKRPILSSTLQQFGQFCIFTFLCLRPVLIIYWYLSLGLLNVFLPLKFTSNIFMHIATHTRYMSALIILDFVTVIHVTLSTYDEGRHYAVFSSLQLPLLSYRVFICPNFLLNTLFSNTHRLY
jgi:hypothetical protein